MFKNRFVRRGFGAMVRSIMTMLIDRFKELIARTFRTETEEERLERLSQTHGGHQGGGAMDQRHIDLQYRSSGCGE